MLCATHCVAHNTMCARVCVCMRVCVCVCDIDETAGRKATINEVVGKRGVTRLVLMMIVIICIYTTSDLDRTVTLR